MSDDFLHVHTFVSLLKSISCIKELEGTLCDIHATVVSVEVHFRDTLSIFTSRPPRRLAHHKPRSVGRCSLS